MKSLRYRMNRSTYWLGCAVLMTIFGIVVYFNISGGFLEVAVILLGVPRLHDIGRSGWVVAGVILAEVVIITGLAIMGVSMDTLLIAGGVIALGMAILGIWLGCIPSDPRPNKWGEVPAAGLQFGKRRAT